MARSIEETFRAVAPRRRNSQAGFVTTPVDAVAGGATLQPALNEAAQEIARLRESYQRQADLIAANTTALLSQGGGKSGVAAVAGSVTSHALGGVTGLLSPIVSGLLGLFRGHSEQPATLPVYTPPAPVAIEATLRNSTVAGAPAPTAPAQAQPAYAPQITVNVNAMDSQSFMDRSTDIANAVREAMLNNHPINGVVSEL
jgi:hypothetical protein